MRLASLFLVVFAAAACGGESGLHGYGISLTAPNGWHLSVARGAWTAATVPLPSQTDRLSESLRRGDLGVLLFEDTPDAQWSPPLDYAVYRDGAPQPFTARDFSGPPFGGDNPGNHGFARRNFTVAGRYFDLFAESGSPHPSHRRLAELNALVGSLHIRPGDFYPGGAEPARFRPARGWRVTTVGALPNGTSMFSLTVAATGRYVDPLNGDAPRRTLPRLGRNGITIVVRLDADNRAPPPATSTTLHLSPPGPCIVGDGPPLPHASCSSATRVVGREYTVEVAVFYGRARSTTAQRARAQAELARLVLPRWVRWY